MEVFAIHGNCEIGTASSVLNWIELVKKNHLHLLRKAFAYFTEMSDLVVFCMFCPFVFCSFFIFGFLWWLWLLFFVVVIIYIGFKTQNMQLLTKTHNNYLQNNKNFAHSLDIETYKYVAQHGLEKEWAAWVNETHIIRMGAFMYISFSFDHESCLSIIINRSIENQYCPISQRSENSFIERTRSAKCRLVCMCKCGCVCECVWKFLRWKKYQIGFCFEGEKKCWIIKWHSV